MRIPFRSTLPLLAGLALSCGPAGAAEPLPISGLYSSMRVTAAEDWVGMEILLSYTHRGYFAVLQCAGGADATQPVVVAVREENDGQLRFAAHTDPDNECPMESFSGRRTAKGLQLRFPSGYAPGTLLRGSSFWNRR